MLRLCLEGSNTMTCPQIRQAPHAAVLLPRGELFDQNENQNL